MRVESQGLENFQAFAFFLKLRVNEGMLRFSIAFITEKVKSVQSALSDLKRPPERLQSQCNYRSFIT